LIKTFFQGSSHQFSTYAPITWFQIGTLLTGNLESSTPMCGTASLCQFLLAVRSIILGRPTTFPGSSILIPHSMKRNIRRTARCSSRPHSPSLMDCRSLPLQLRLPMRSCTSANRSGLSLDELCTSSRTSTPA